METAMYRNELDLLHAEPRADAPAVQDANAPAQVFWEIGLVLATFLGLASAIDLAFRLAH
jgi:hypothetical protein